MALIGEDALSVVGMFGEPESALVAVDALKRDGFSNDVISVISGTPYPDETFGLDKPKSIIPWLALAGAVGGLILGFALAAGTAWLYPIETGGKPIISLPTVGIIAYEIMMLGALVMTVLGVIFTAKLPAVRPHLWDICISEGCLGVLVQSKSKDTIAQAEKSLHRSGARDIRRFRERVVL